MSLASDIEILTGARVVRTTPLSGGDLSAVWRVILADGRVAVAKRTATAGAEARMLAAIRATGCPAPADLGHSDDLVVMECLGDGGRADDAAWQAAGRAIRTLHGHSGTRYGWNEDHAFGAVPIPNAWQEDDWPSFWAERRLLAELAALPKALGHRLERLAGRIGDLLPDRPAPSLLHGDLWSGNLLFGASGFSGVIDPAAYFGHAEVDLAMLTLFGAPPPAFRDGYGSLAPGAAERRPVYQLWPAIVHFRLFGAGYAPMVDRLLSQAGA